MEGDRRRGEYHCTATKKSTRGFVRSNTLLEGSLCWSTKAMSNTFTTRLRLCCLRFTAGRDRFQARARSGEHSPCLFLRFTIWNVPPMERRSKTVTQGAKPSERDLLICRDKLTLLRSQWALRKRIEDNNSAAELKNVINGIKKWE